MDYNFCFNVSMATQSSVENLRLLEILRVSKVFYFILFFLPLLNLYISEFYLD